MLVDHVRETFYLHQQVADPVDALTTSPELFYTRLTSAICAPVFIWLTGLSAWLYSQKHSKVETSKLILTTGTFLNGLIHVGEKQTPAGRYNEKPTTGLSEQLQKLNFKIGRLKTGTPPRLDSRTINFNNLEEQFADDDPYFFSFLTKKNLNKQISCRMTYTNETVHKIISKNIKRSAMYSGCIQGVGPRYCPSIEDKVVKFAEKQRHQIFLEPEGLNDYTVYPNGISTSLPAEVQQEICSKINGLENVKILRPGYAIEYDFVDPRELFLTCLLYTSPSPRDGLLCRMPSSA